jgi:hypothetical protein
MVVETGLRRLSLRAARRPRAASSVPTPETGPHFVPGNIGIVGGVRIATIELLSMPIGNGDVGRAETLPDLVEQLDSIGLRKPKDLIQKRGGGHGFNFASAHTGDK